MHTAQTKRQLIEWIDKITGWEALLKEIGSDRLELRGEDRSVDDEG